MEGNRAIVEEVENAEWIRSARGVGLIQDGRTGHDLHSPDTGNLP